MEDESTFEGELRTVRRERFSVSTRDAVRLAAWRYLPDGNPGRTGPPLLCLGSETGNAAEHHAFAIAVLNEPAPPRAVWTVDLRGRGQSEAGRIATSDLSTDVEDLVDVTDALTLHHLDVLANGFSTVAVLKVLLKRPGLVRRMVMNDGAPELDGVARANAAMRRAGRSAPTDRERTAGMLRETTKGFEGLDEEGWNAMAERLWRPGAKGWEPAHHPDLQRTTNAVSFDEAQPDGWNELPLLRRTPTLLLRAAGSNFVTDAIESRMRGALDRLEVQRVEGQGHVPMLERGDLPARIATFLSH